MKQIACPKCKGEDLVKAALLKKTAVPLQTLWLFFTVLKEGKNIDPYYVIKALQLYIEGYF